MKRFVRKKETGTLKSTMISVAVFVGIMILFLFSIHVTGEQTKAEQKKYLEQAIERCVIQCYATEGRFPQSLDYIVENYGLVYDKESFFVDYQAVGSNLRPEITVLEKRRTP